MRRESVLFHTDRWLLAVIDPRTLRRFRLINTLYRLDSNYELMWETASSLYRTDGRTNTFRVCIVRGREERRKREEEEEEERRDLICMK